MITEIRVPKVGSAGWSYLKFRQRALDWATVGVAAVVGAANGSIEGARIAFTNMGQTPLRASATEAALAGAPRDGVAAAPAATPSPFPHHSSNGVMSTPRRRPSNFPASELRHDSNCVPTSSGTAEDAVPPKAHRRRRLGECIDIYAQEYPMSAPAVPVRSGDRILLCTDGIYRQLDDDELRLTLGTGTARQAAEGLVEQADRAGGKDNSTAVVVEVGVTNGGHDG